MNNFEKIIFNLDKEVESINNPNWVSMTADTIGVLTEIIEQEERTENIKNGQRVMDLGSGSGTAAFTWARNGYKVIGIEIDTELYNISINAQEKHSELKKLGVQFYNGSYYPVEYKKTSRTRRIENRILKQYGKKNMYFISFTDTIYADNNIDMKKIDIFYAYAWPFQMPSIFEMFYTHARDDAKLIAIGPNRDAILQKYPELTIKYNTIKKNVKKNN